jgi:hypothetical protein
MTKSGAFHKREKALSFARRNHSHGKPKPLTQARLTEQTRAYETPDDDTEQTEQSEWDAFISKIPKKVIPVIIVAVLGFISLFAAQFDDINNNAWDDEGDDWTYGEQEYIGTNARMMLPTWSVEYDENAFGRDNYYLNYEEDEALYVCYDFAAYDETAVQIDKALLDSKQVESALENAETGVPLLQNSYSLLADNDAEQGYYFPMSDTYIDGEFDFKITPGTYDVSENDSTIIATCDYTVPDYPGIFGSLYFIKEYGSPTYLLLYTTIKDPLSTEYLKADLVTHFRDYITWYNE